MNEAAIVTSVKSFREAEDLIRTADRSDPEVRKQLGSLTAVLRKFLHKDENCVCQCDDCVGGDCDDCYNGVCFDENCEGHTDEERQQAQQTVALLWVGSAANYAAKLSSISEQPYSTFISAACLTK